jgi:hypothetical protein
MTITSIPFLYSYFQNGCDLNDFPLLNSAIANVWCTYFVTYLLADMFFGFYYYPDQMNLVTGWIHHIIYLFLIPGIISNHLAGAFMINMFMELPTIFLSVGFLFPALKSEYLFGSTFFITRIGMIA